MLFTNETALSIIQVLLMMLEAETKGAKNMELTLGERIDAVYGLRDILTKAIELASSRGLTDENIQCVWLFVCEQKGIYPKIGQFLTA